MFKKKSFILLEVELLMNSTTQYGKMILARYLPYVPLEIKGWGSFPQRIKNPHQKIITPHLFSIFCKWSRFFIELIRIRIANTEEFLHTCYASRAQKGHFHPDCCDYRLHYTYRKNGSKREDHPRCIYCGRHSGCLCCHCQG